MKNVLEIAERIMKANNTLSIQTELFKLYGGHASPSSLAMNAANMVVFHGHKLSFTY